MTRENKGEISGREIALDILFEVMERGAKSHLVLRQALDKYRYLEKQERAFITRLTEGTLEYELQIDAVIDRYSKTRVSKMKPLIRCLLRLSVYQILYLDRVPDSAVCNEAVKLARKRHFDGLTGFINGVLRTIAREKEAIAFDELWLRYSVPEWMMRLWEKAYGSETAGKMAAAFLKERPLTVRVNTSLAEPQEVKKSLSGQGITVCDTPFDESILEITGYDALDLIPEFTGGILTVQDASSALVGLAAAPKKGDFILDVCSAPGGKALHLADRLNLLGAGLVEARDISEYKVSLIEENISRCGFSNIRTRVWDASVYDPSMEGQADIVLADLPCSGLGILGKKPDIKRRLKEEELKELAAFQRELLRAVSRYVKPGGTLIYSTCTVNPAENDDNAKFILEELPFEKRPLAPYLPVFLRESVREHTLQLLPGIHPCDGFFIASFRRKAD